MVRCLNCSDPAELSLSWVTSAGFTRVPLCGHCAAAWWSDWRNNGVHETVTIDPDPTLPMVAQGQEVALATVGVTSAA